MTRRKWVSLFGVSSLVGLAGCSEQSQGGQNTDEEDSTEGEESSIEEKAREEGEVVVYSSIDEPAWLDTLKPRFEEAYPDITANVVSLGSSEATSKILSEYNSGNVQGDVATITKGAGDAIRGEGVYRVVDSSHHLYQQAEEMGYPSSLYSGGYEFPSYNVPITLLFNTDIVSEEDAPTTWEALGDEQWSGEIVMQNPSQLSATAGLFATLYGVWGEEKWRTVMENIAANEPQLTNSGSQAYRIMAQGEKGLTPNYINDLVSAKQNESPPPISTTWPEPTVSLALTEHLLKDAPHPNAAELWIRWMMSEEGQTALADTGRTPFHAPTASSHENFEGIIPSDVKIQSVAYNDPTWNGSNFTEDPEGWLPLFEEYFGS